MESSEVKGVLTIASAVWLLSPVGLLGQLNLPTREEVLAAVYPDATIEAERVFLTREQVGRASALARGDIDTQLVARYVAWEGDQVVGRAYVDTHVVRTKRESLLIALGSDGAVKRIEATAFLEPREYMAPEPWRRQFDGRRLSDEVALGRSIRPIAGATLTAHSTTDAVRRVMAIDQVLKATEAPGQ